MNLGRAPTAFDVALLMAVVVAAVVWATALNPSLVGLTALLAMIVLSMVVITGWILVRVSESLTGKYDAIIRTILRTRNDFLSAGWPEDWVHGIRGILRELGSAFLFLLTFLFYFSVMIVFFYGLGGQLLSDPNRLMIAAFLGTSVLHFSGRIEGQSTRKVVLDFLVPFGIIVGLIDLTVIGPYSLLSLGFTYGPVVLLLFAAYYVLDLIVQWRGGRERQLGSANGTNLKTASGSQGTNESGQRAHGSEEPHHRPDPP